MDDLGLAVDPREGILGPFGACVAHDPAQRIPPRRTEGEGLADGHRAIDEVVVGSDQLHVHRVTRECSKAKKSLDSRDATATDHCSEISHDQNVRGSKGAAIGALPQRTLR